MSLPETLRKWVEIGAILVAAISVLVAVINRLFLVHLLGRVEVLLQLAAVAMLVAVWAVMDEMRTSRPK